MHGVVYTITNGTNGKVYVGQTTQPLRCRWAQHKHSVRRGSKTPFHMALAKHGVENFTVCMVGSADNQTALDCMEDSFMNLLQSRNRLRGYNRDASGRVIRDPEVGLKISLANKGRVAWNKGQTMDAQYRAARSTAATGRTLTQEVKDKMRVAARLRQGRVRSSDKVCCG